MNVFFTLYREGARTETRQYREQLDIAVVTIMKFEYYKELRNRYSQMLNPKSGQLPDKPPEYYIKSDSQEARDLMFAVFRRAKRSMGYG